MAQAFHTLYDGIRDADGNLQKFSLVEIRGDWKYMKVPAVAKRNVTYGFKIKTNMFWVILPLVNPVQEVLNLRNFYQCNNICHECKVDKDTYMVPKLQAPRYNSDEFWRQCIKPGPICFLVLKLRLFVIPVCFHHQNPKKVALVQPAGLNPEHP